MSIFLASMTYCHLFGFKQADKRHKDLEKLWSDWKAFHQQLKGHWDCPILQPSSIGVWTDYCRWKNPLNTCSLVFLCFFVLLFAQQWLKGRIISEQDCCLSVAQKEWAHHDFKGYHRSLKCRKKKKKDTVFFPCCYIF